MVLAWMGSRIRNLLVVFRAVDNLTTRFRNALDWSAEQGSAVFGSLVGHILYGLILGVAYATIDKIWVRLFIQSDPLNREIEGPGLHILRSLGWGARAGLIGGLVSMPVMMPRASCRNSRASTVPL